VFSQEVHELLRNYELKYCFVDKYKGTAFVTLLNGEQAEGAIREFHGSKLRDKELWVQLQPTDSLLCVANLPRLFSQHQFEELVRPFGNVERCFLVYSRSSGHSKGYGFVEYMKKDSAARAKSDLLGKQLGTRTLYVHWMDGQQLSWESLHSRCLCVEKLPHNYSDLERLRGVFSAACAPTFCQVWGRGGGKGGRGERRGFGMREKEVLGIGITQSLGPHIQIPGVFPLNPFVSWFSKALNRGKGLLPEPNILQILNSLGNPASLQLLLHPLLHGGKQGILGAAPSLPLVTNPALSTALLQLALHGQAQKPGILGDSPLSSLSLGLANAPAQPSGKLLAEIPSGGPLPGDLAQGHGKSPILPSGNVALASFLAQVGAEREKLGTAGTPPGPPGLGSALGAIPKSKQGESAAPAVSLLGEPPKDFKIPLNPYLNLRSLLPLPGIPGEGGGARTPQTFPPFPGPPLLNPPTHPHYIFPGNCSPCSNPSHFSLGKDLNSRIFPQPRDPSGSILGGFGPGRNKVSSPSPGLERGRNLGPPLGPFFSGSPSSYFSSGLQAGLSQSHLSK
ncbi:RAVR1 protein, partial [Pitta sordida]|nr:RAVR1 protein [Pitta sordida]